MGISPTEPGAPIDVTLTQTPRRTYLSGTKQNMSAYVMRMNFLAKY
jgi:hypothetical protein